MEGDPAAPEVKMPKCPKALRYYYKHREEVLERRRQKLMEDPEYVAKKAARESKKQAQEEAKNVAKQAREAMKEAVKKEREDKKETDKENKRREMAKRLGLEIPGQN